MAVLTWYAVGIIEKSNMEDALVNRVEQITEMLDSRQKEYDKTAALMYDDYKSRVRALSMHIAEEPELMDNETQFEGLRMMTGAEVISVTDENLKIFRLFSLTPGCRRCSPSGSPSRSASRTARLFSWQM